MKKAEIPAHVLKVSMEQAARRGWADLSLLDIADASGVDLADMHALFPTKSAILRGISARADQAVLADGATDRLGEPAKDRLFDVLMTRFEALHPYRDGLAAVVRDSLRDPLAAGWNLMSLGASMQTMLEAAGFSTTGLRGAIRIKALGTVYLKAFRVWLNDDSEDLTKTMAVLDKSLSRLDSLAGRCRRDRETAKA